MEALLQTLEMNLSNDNNTRRQSEETLRNMSVEEGFGPALATLAVDPSMAEVPLRQLASVFLKQLIKERWPQTSETAVSNADKEQLRQNLVHGLTDDNNRIRYDDVMICATSFYMLFMHLTLLFSL